MAATCCFRSMCTVAANSENHPPTVSNRRCWSKVLRASTSFETYVKGRRLHHVPIMLEDISCGAAMARTIPLLLATGYRVDTEFWVTGESCCPPNPPQLPPPAVPVV